MNDMYYAKEQLTILRVLATTPVAMEAKTLKSVSFRNEEKLLIDALICVWDSFVFLKNGNKLFQWQVSPKCWFDWCARYHTGMYIKFREKACKN